MRDQIEQFSNKNIANILDRKSVTLVSILKADLMLRFLFSKIILPTSERIEVLNIYVFIMNTGQVIKVVRNSSRSHMSML